MPKRKINVSQIRALASHYAAGELQVCIQEALDTGANDCLPIADLEEDLSILSMAGFVRARMEHEAIPVSQALRILGQRMRGLT